MRNTEKDSLYSDLEKKDISEIIQDINREDKKVAIAVGNKQKAISTVAEEVYSRMKEGGRLFYIGAGTSGRLGILDASECPPTFGVSHNLVVGIIAGGDSAIRNAVENAEDDTDQAWEDLKKCNIGPNDFVVGIAASGTTPYVIGGIKRCREKGIGTACITCSENSPLAEACAFPIEVIVGPEYVTGSTRMKAGTAQKMVLNMISTAVMIRLGRVKGNKMVDMQLSNDKLVDRGTRMIMESSTLSYDEAQSYLTTYGSVRKALEKWKTNE